MTRTASGNFSERSISPELDFMDGGSSSRDYRSDGSRHRSYRHRNYESDYDEQSFSQTNSGRNHQYEEYRRRAQQSSTALEHRRRMFEREHHKQAVDDRRRVEHDFFDYSDVEYGRRHSQRQNRERERERERERVAEYRRYFQQLSAPDDFSRTLKPSMRRQDSNTSQDSYNRRHYPDGQFEMYRSRFEVKQIQFV